MRYENRSANAKASGEPHVQKNLPYHQPYGFSAAWRLVFNFPALFDMDS